jgi:putative ABC transport system permease protein
MFNNFLKTAFRSMAGNKLLSCIQVFGLVFGMLICGFIAVYLLNEWSFDRFNTNYKYIYRVDVDNKFGGNEASYANSCPPLAKFLMASFPEIREAARICKSEGLDLKKGSEPIHEEKVAYADGSIFRVFTLHMIEGSPLTALDKPGNVVISESLARKYFGIGPFLGRGLQTADGKQLIVTGVVRDLPPQSHFHVDIYLAMSELKESFQNTWTSNSVFNTYVLLAPGTSISELEAKFRPFIARYAGPEIESIIHVNYKKFEDAGNYFRLSLIPLADIHLRSDRIGEFEVNGHSREVYIFLLTGILILMVACFNFINLATAVLSGRAKEVGIRKVLGSSRKLLILQFIGEAVLMAFGAVVLAVILMASLIPLFERLVGKELFLTKGDLARAIPWLVLVPLAVGGIAGLYPALILSGVSPARVLKGRSWTHLGNRKLRSALVVFQFSISTFLAVGALVMKGQIDYIRQKDLGYDKTNVLVLGNMSGAGREAITLKEEISKLPGVAGATLTGYIPTGKKRSSNSLFMDRSLRPSSALLTEFWPVDPDYLSTYDIRLTEGRNFTKDYATDSGSVIINEMAKAKLGAESAIDKILYYPDDQNPGKIKPYRVIGVMKDFNFNSLREQVTPLILTLSRDNDALSIKYDNRDFTRLIVEIRSKWRDIFPDRSFRYSFVDKDFEAQYRSESSLAKLNSIFTFMAILIACVGFFGLSAYMANQRAKEISIRKVLGATVFSILVKLTMDYMVLIGISLAIALPIGTAVMQNWLNGFAYRTTVQAWMLAWAAGIAVAGALLSITYHVSKAAFLQLTGNLRNDN